MIILDTLLIAKYSKFTHLFVILLLRKKYLLLETIDRYFFIVALLSSLNLFKENFLITMLIVPIPAWVAIHLFKSPGCTDSVGYGFYSFPNTIRYQNLITFITAPLYPISNTKATLYWIEDVLVSGQKLFVTKETVRIFPPNEEFLIWNSWNALWIVESDRLNTTTQFRHLIQAEGLYYR